MVIKAPQFYLYGQVMKGKKEKKKKNQKNSSGPPDAGEESFKLDKVELRSI